MKKSVENLKWILEADGKVPDNDSCYYIVATLDGTWQKRYGFNSLYGAIFFNVIADWWSYWLCFQE